MLLDETPIVSLPPYLRAVSVLDPAGDGVGDTLNAVARLAKERNGRIARRIGVPAAGVLALGAGLWFAGSLRDRGTTGTNTTGGGPIDVPPADSAATVTYDDDNSRVWKLKNDRHVRLAGQIVANESNVADNIVRDAVEYSAWRYNRCYDGAFGHLAGSLPEGAVRPLTPEELQGLKA